MSFDILDHFANTFDRRLDLNHMPSDLRIVRLGTDRIGFSKHLLSYELQLAASSIPIVHDGIELVQVAAKPHRLFGNVTAFGKQSDLSNQVRRFDL